jgi:starch synthase
MNLLFVSSECAPFVKTGGLADVIGALPRALANCDVDVRILLPAYREFAELLKTGTQVLAIRNLFGGPASVVSVQADGLDLLLLDAMHLYDRDSGIYQDKSGQDWSDNHLRFGALSFVGAKLASEGIGGWQPDVVNAHDWQAGLVPAYLSQIKKPVPPCVFTIHNIAFQGRFDSKLRVDLGLDEKLFTQEGIEYFGDISFLKAGIALSDKITTVSPTYANELLLPEFGMGLEGLLKHRQKDLIGILNGVDMEVWNPESDSLIEANYSVRSLAGKKTNRIEIESRFGLTPVKDSPIFCVISRLTTQKGLDLLLETIDDLVEQGARLALLGSGEKWLEDGFVEAARKYQGSVGVIIGYDEPLSHLMQAGCDAILIPSRFEPCGLTQLYGLRYGTLPVVARTGGLADTIIDANAAALAAGCATGIQFYPVTKPALTRAIINACDFYKDKKLWRGMMRRAMRQSVSWDRSAGLYAKIYQELSAKTKSKSPTK